MGEGLRDVYAPLLGTSGCGFYVWSDSADSRTRQSGDAIARGLAPKCAGRTGHGPEGADDPLFDAVDAKVCAVDPIRAKESIETRLATMLKRDARAYADGRRALQKILTPNADVANGPAQCRDDKKKNCRVAGGDNKITGARLEGPLNLGSTLSEVLLLEYSQGLPPGQNGWGRANKQTIATALNLHNLYSDTVRRNPYLAARRGSHLMRAILNAMENKPDRELAKAKMPDDSRILLFQGHDTNLANMSGLLDAAWTLPGQPDVTAPNTAVTFEVWRDDAGTRRVKLRVFYQTMDQLRDLTRFDASRPVPSVALSLQGCGKDGCSLDDFRARMMPRLAADCLETR
jgi:4-phytase/acid phosphatase